MSTQILAPSADTAGLTVDDDTVSVAKAFAIIGGSCIAFLAASVIAIASAS